MLSEVRLRRQDLVELAIVFEGQTLRVGGQSSDGC